MREIELTFLGVAANVELIVEGSDEDGAIFDEQRESYRRLPDAIRKAEDRLFDFYRSICDDYRSRFDDDADIRMPGIGNKSEFSNLV